MASWVCPMRPPLFRHVRAAEAAALVSFPAAGTFSSLRLSRPGGPSLRPAPFLPWRSPRLAVNVSAMGGTAGRDSPPLSPGEGPNAPPPRPAGPPPPAGIAARWLLAARDVSAAASVLDMVTAWATSGGGAEAGLGRHNTRCVKSSL